MPKLPKTKINLFYLSHNPYGGWAAFTTHLHMTLRRVGVECNLYKVGNKTESKARDFGYGITYQNIDLEEALKLSGHKLICALGGKYKEQGKSLLNAGAHIVKHDPGESKWFDAPVDQTIVIRKVNLFEGATFIPHPYIPKHGYKLKSPRKLKNATTVSRIDSDKRTEVIIQANRLLPEELKISFHGFGHTTYARFYLKDKYPEWKKLITEGKPNPTKFAKDNIYNAVDILRGHLFAVDLSVIRKDGGGTQYTFLEAWDAEALQIIHMDWVLPDDAMKPGVNCLAVDHPEHLADIITGESGTKKRRNFILNNAKQQLKQHAPELIGNQYLDYFERV